ncbi:MAG: hypothetical protein WBQ18_19165 [Solirubrobacteraceae bacterium]
MHRLTRRSVLVLIVIGALVAGGAAYTNTISGAGTTNNTAGYHDITVHGASLTDAKYGLSTDGSLIDTVTFTFANDLTNDRLQYIVDTAPAAGGGSGTPLEDCNGDSNVTTGGIIGSGAVSSGVTSVVCTLATPVSTETATDLDVVVTNN